MKSCFKDAAEGSKTAPVPYGTFVPAELIKWNGAICDPAMKAISTIGIHSIAVVEYVCRQTLPINVCHQLACFHKNRRLCIVFFRYLEDFAMEARA